MSKLIRVPDKVHCALKRNEKLTGVKMGRQIEFKVFGKPSSVKRLGEL
jgi:hypothetical protein